MWTLSLLAATSFHFPMLVALNFDGASAEGHHQNVKTKPWCGKTRLSSNFNSFEKSYESSMKTKKEYFSI